MYDLMVIAPDCTSGTDVLGEHYDDCGTKAAVPYFIIFQVIPLCIGINNVSCR